jgi:glycerol-3-phosphate dehydrogenase
MYDVVIIGAGVSGSSIARELARYQAKICVVEKEEDVCCGTSKANSGIVHAGYGAKEGSLMAKLNIKGNEMMESLAAELDVPFVRNGSLVVCTDEKDMDSLNELYQRGIHNAVPGIRLLNREEVRQMEPNLAKEVIAALYAPSGGIVCPFTLTIAMAENAASNGVEFKFNTKVDEIKAYEQGWALLTNQGRIETKYVVNAAGVYADVFHNMVSNKKIHITARRGDYCLLDRTTEGLVTRTIFQLPTKYGKGVLVTPTVHGNTLIGPTAIDIPNKEGTNTTAEGLDNLVKTAGISVTDIPLQKVITAFAGLRAHEDGHEFIIGEVEGAQGFIDCAGIESPGLSSSPAIAVTVAGLLQEKMNLAPNPDFVGKRKGIINPKELSKEEYRKLIQEKPEYGTIVCRCEMITEGEIIDAIKRPLGAKSLDGVKRRTRAGMGRCQSGFCLPRTMEILARERNIPIHEITKSGQASAVIVGINKENL